MGGEPRRVLTPGLVFGVALLVFGVLLTLDNMDVIDARAYWKYWPAAVILGGLLKMGERGGRLAGLVWAAIGVWLLLGNLRLVPLRFWDLWPGVIFFIIGLALVRRALRGPGEGASSDETINMFAMMGGSKRVSHSPSFRGASVVAIMGGCELDLTNASPADGEAVVDAFAMMGGVEITVGTDWKVVIEGVPVMGAIEDNTQPPSDPSAPLTKRLVIRGAALMGAVEVKSPGAATS